MAAQSSKFSKMNMNMNPGVALGLNLNTLIYFLILYK